MSGLIQVYITVGTQEEGQRLIRNLVKSRLVACGQILGPIQSTYWWQEKMETSQEWLCLAKSKESNFGRIVHQVKQLHSYEVPEIIAVPLVAADENYARWANEILKKAP